MAATTSYLEGLGAFGESQRELQTMKDGTPLYDGSPHHFEDWKCRVETMLQAAEYEKEEDKDRRLVTIGTKTFQGLSKQAHVVVRSLSLQA